MLPRRVQSATPPAPWRAGGLTGSRAQVARAFAPTAALGTRMPSPHPTNRPPADPPTRTQLQLLRRFAHASGQTFTTPRTKAQASREIQRLAEISNNTPIEELIAERTSEPERLRDTGPRDAAAIQPREITGYGANARWKHRHQDRGGRS
jgi:hypothetical protein